MTLLNCILGPFARQSSWKSLLTQWAEIHPSDIYSFTLSS